MKYLGVDVSKDKLDCCLLRDAGDTKRKTKVVANSPSGLATLLSFVEKDGIPPDELHVILEGTGVYHQLAAETLSDAGATVSIANPAQVKNFGHGMAVRTKNDTKDSFVLARFGALLKPAPWTPPSPAARQLQAYIAREDAIKKDIQREHNRKETSIVGRVPGDVLASIEETIGFLNAQLEAIRKKIDSHIDKHPDLKDDMKLLTSIPRRRAGNRTSHAVRHAHPPVPLGRTTRSLSWPGACRTPIWNKSARASKAIEGRAENNARCLVHACNIGPEVESAHTGTQGTPRR